MKTIIKELHTKNGVIYVPKTIREKGDTTLLELALTPCVISPFFIMLWIVIPFAVIQLMPGFTGSSTSPFPSVHSFRGRAL